MARILVVEDDDAVREVVQMALRSDHLDVDVVATGRQALDRYEVMRPDVLVLDVMLPEVDGIEVCRWIRQHDTTTPIIMLSARTDPIDVVLGLESGADDYVTKPFEVRVLLARVRAALRRTRPSTSPEEARIRVGQLEIDTAAMEATLAGVVLDLTATEYRLLLALARHPGQVHSRESLLREVWDYEFLGDSRLVDVGIGRLRGKLGDDPRDPTWVKTRRGLGYCLVRR